MIYNSYSEANDNLLNLQIKSCGHIFAQTGHMISQLNECAEWLLFYIVKGQETFYQSQKEIMKEGSFIFYRPFERQKHCYIDNPKSEFYYIYFSAPDDFDPFGFQSSRIYHCTPCAEICLIFEKIIAEIRCKGNDHERSSVSLFLTLLETLGRICDCKTTATQKYIEKINFSIQRMIQDYDSPTSLDDYAALSNMSKYHFLRTFKAITGMPPLAYRNEIRLSKAKELLGHSEIPINEVGELTGYSSPSYFSDAFKEKTGLSPLQYRKQQLNPPDNIDFICKIASLEEIHTKWINEILPYSNKSAYNSWNQTLMHIEKGQQITYYGILNGQVITEGSAFLDTCIVPNHIGLIDEKTAYLCNLHTVPKYQEKGYFSRLFHFMLQDLRSRRYEKVTIGIEPNKPQSMHFFFHYGFTEYIKTATEVKSSGEHIDVLYYSKQL